MYHILIRHLSVIHPVVSLSLAFKTKARTGKDLYSSSSWCHETPISKSESSSSSLEASIIQSAELFNRYYYLPNLPILPGDSRSSSAHQITFLPVYFSPLLPLIEDMFLFLTEINPLFKSKSEPLSSPPVGNMLEQSRIWWSPGQPTTEQLLHTADVFTERTDCTFKMTCNNMTEKSKFNCFFILFFTGCVLIWHPVIWITAAFYILGHHCELICCI